MVSKVAVLTTFMDLPSGYGLVPVVLNQLRMLVEHGYKPGFFVVEGFEKHPDMKKVPEGVEVKPCVPFMHLYDYQPGTKKQTYNVSAKGVYGKPSKTNFDKQVKLIEEKLEPELSKYNVVITHDIVFQTWFVVHNQAIRNIAKRHPNIRWIHWLHSGPQPRPNKLEYPHTLRFSGMPNSVWVSPNESMIPKFAEMYNIPRKKVKAVYHTFDVYKFFDMHPWSIKLIEKHNLLNCDVLCVWATRIDHPEGKGLRKAIWVIAQLNKLVDAKLLFLNSWSNRPESKQTIANLRKEADMWGLPQENLIFSSEMGKEWELGVPHKVVRDMLWIANLFILPSQSETFSLAMVEAAACKNLLVLNEDLTVMHELAEDNAIYSYFGSEWGGVKITRHYEPNAQAFFMDEARRILEELKKHKSLMQHRKVLRVFNNDWVWKNQLEPLIEGKW